MLQALAAPSSKVLVQWQELQDWICLQASSIFPNPQYLLPQCKSNELVPACFQEMLNVLLSDRPAKRRGEKQNVHQNHPIRIQIA